MNSKYVSAFALLLSGASAAFAQITLNSVPSRSLGSPALNITSLSPNLVEGRELYIPQGVALDMSTTPPSLYVSDYGNNRVLGWRDANSFGSGQKADIQIGQPDLVTTFSGGPSISNYSTGLNRPTGIAVYKGDLYVADCGNNRVLRYPAPFNQVSQQQRQFPLPDLYIGQPSVNGRSANYNGRIDAQGIFLSNSNGSTIYQANIAFDSAGNLWMTDPGNARVLRFRAADVTAGGGGLTADLELGQPDFSTVQSALGTDAASIRRTNQFYRPSALAFDPNGNLFVSDSNSGATVSRVLVFTPSFSTGMSAARLMGIFPVGTTTPAQTVQDNTLMADPEGIFFLTGSASGVGIVDSASNRILIFDAYANWPADGVTPPQARSILGQPNTCTAYPTSACRSANNGNPRASNSTFFGPIGVAYSGTDLFVVDSFNNRVVDLPQSGNSFGSATRVLGQDRFDTNSPNLIEGREFEFLNSGGTTDSAIAIDTTGSVPHLYVSDSGNNRVLGFKDIRGIKPGAKADIVLGQPDMQTAVPNYPSGDINKPTATNLARPVGLAVDSKGNLYVADSLNGRVLRYPAPFASGVAAGEAADLVLGKPNFTTGNFPDANNSNLYVPYGLAFSGVNGLVVSDQNTNRLLYFPMTNGTFTAGADNGKAATIVFGQQSFNSIVKGNDTASMSSPHHVSCDNTGFVYVADSGNNRVLIFNDPNTPSTSPTGEHASAAITGLNAPLGVFVNPTTREIWVANTGAGTNLRYADYNAVLLGNGSISSIPEISGGFQLHPLTSAQDAYGALVVTDDASRLAIYYPGLNALNGGSFLPLASHPLAPNLLASIFPCTLCSGTQFLTQQNNFTGYPMKTILGDVQVLMDGVATPLYIVYPNQINFVVPNGARTSGFADLQVVQVSTGQVLGATQVPMAAAAPTLMENPGGQTGANHYVAVINQDGHTVNTPSDPAPVGSTVSLYATGEGFVPNAPPDGVPATQVTPAQNAVTVYMNGTDVNNYPNNGCTVGTGATPCIQYSGLNGYPGLWQINVQIPKSVVPGSVSGVPAPGVIVQIVVNGKANTDAGGFKTVLAVK